MGSPAHAARLDGVSFACVTWITAARTRL